MHYCPRCGSTHVGLDYEDEEWESGIVDTVRCCFHCGFMGDGSYMEPLEWNYECGKLMRSYKPMLRRLLRKQWRKHR